MGSILEDSEGVGMRDGGGDGGEVVGVEGAGGRAGGAVDGGVGGAARARLSVGRSRTRRVRSKAEEMAPEDSETRRVTGRP